VACFFLAKGSVAAVGFGGVFWFFLVVVPVFFFFWLVLWRVVFFYFLDCVFRGFGGGGGFVESRSPQRYWSFFFFDSPTDVFLSVPLGGLKGSHFWLVGLLFHRGGLVPSRL